MSSSILFVGAAVALLVGLTFGSLGVIHQIRIRRHINRLRRTPLDRPSR